jgi:hypothetical protein
MSRETSRKAAEWLIARIAADSGDGWTAFLCGLNNVPVLVALLLLPNLGHLERSPMDGGRFV